MILAAPLLALVLSQSAGNLPTKAVTYHTRAKLLPKVLEEIAEKSGERLKCGMTLANEVVIMEVKDAPLSDLMPQLAEAVCGKWTKSQDEWILSLDANQARQEERAEIAARKPLFEKALKPYLEGLEKPFGGKDADELIKGLKTTQLEDDGGFRTIEFKTMIENGARSPGGRAIGRALRSIDLALLAAMKEGDRLVFSTHPTLSQLPFGKAANSLIAQVVKEQEVWSSARASFPSRGARVGLLNIGDVHDQNPIVESPMKANLIVELAEHQGTPSIDLQLANSEGYVIYRCRTDLTLDFPSSGAAPAIPKTLKWSENTKSLLEDLRKNTAPQMQIAEPRVSEAWEKELIRCQQVDPHHYFMSDMFFAIGRASADNWIGVPNDENWGWHLVSALKSLSGEMPSKLHWHSEAKSVVNGISWSIIRPRSPADARRHRADRKLLSRLLQSVQQTRYLGIDSFAEYVYETNHVPSTADLSRVLLSAVNREPNFGQNLQASKSALAFFGSLSSPQRQQLVQGGTILASQLTPAQHDRARQMFFEASPSISAQRMQKLQRDGGPNAYMGLGGSLKMEPTEVLAFGKLPGNAQISGTEGNGESLMAVIEAEHQSNTNADPLNVGRMLGQRISSKQMEGTIAGYRLGNQRSIRLQIDAADTLQVVVHFFELQFDYKKRLLELAELPESVRKEYEKGYAKGVEEGARFGIPASRRSPPPPP